VFGFAVVGQTAVDGTFTELAKWVAVALTVISGWLFLRGTGGLPQDL